MKKIISVLVAILFVCAAFFVFADVSYSSDEVKLTPIFSFGPIITTFSFPVNIPDANLKAALHSATGVPSGDPIYVADLAALTGNLNFDNRGIADLQGIQYCSNITGLFLNDNNLSSVLSSMSGLTSLETLWLSGNSFTTIPAELCTIPNLAELKMDGNPISSVSLDLGCTGLSRLYLNDCAFTSFPSQLLDNGLARLELGGSNIGSLPSNMDTMTGLKWLDVEDCGLSSLPSAIYNMSWLERLYASDNSIESLSSAIGGMTSLEWLVMRSNGLEGIPSEICSLNNLTNLILDKNNLYNLPSGIGNTNIVELSAPFNNIGSIPSSIGNAASLEALDLMLNRIALLPSTFADIDYDILNLEFNYIDLSAGSPARTLIDNATIWTAYVDRQMTPVAGLVATPTDTEITLSWDACPNGSQDGASWTVDSYAVYTYDGSLHKLADLTPADLTYTHTLLAPDTSVDYRVRINYHVVYPLHGIDAMSRCYTKLTAATLAEPAASPTPSITSPTPTVSEMDGAPDDTDGQSDDAADEMEIVIDASDLPEGTAAVQTPSGEIVPVDADGNVRFMMNAVDYHDGMTVVALDDEGMPLEVVNISIAAAGGQSIDLKTPSKSGFPIWAIIVLCIAGAGILGTGLFFGLRAYKKRGSNGPKPPKAPKPPKTPKGGSGKRTAEL